MPLRSITIPTKLLARAKQKYYSNTNRFANNFVFYLPAEEYLKIVTRPVLMTYAFNVADDKENEMEHFIKTYTGKSEPLMNYESRQTAANEFNNMRSMFLMVGGILSFIIWPLFAAYPMLLFLALAIAFVVYRSTMRQSIVERLREAE